VSAYDIHAWVEFGVAVAGAAAVLTGLVFVAVSINLERVLAVPGVPDRAGESVLMFLAVLIYSLFLLVPGQSTTALGVELLVSGLVFAAVLVLVAALGSGGRRPSRCRGRSPASWRRSDPASPQWSRACR
jgi:K+-sensing histidine kinase KdpD